MKKWVRNLLFVFSCFVFIFIGDYGANAAEYTYPVSGGAELVFEPVTGSITDVKNTSKLVSVDVPSDIYGVTVNTIGKDAFRNCKNLLHITLPSTITSIEENAFYSCSSLTSINIPYGVTSIGDYAFEYCSKLESVEIPGSVKLLSGKLMFSGCKSLKEIILSEGIEVIDSNIFYLGESIPITEIKFPNSLKEIIGINSSQTLRNLKTIYFGSNIQTIGDRAFYGSKNLENVYFTGNAPIIGNKVFSDDANVYIYYPINTSGWSTPVWNGYISKPYTPDGVTQPEPVKPTDPDELAPAPSIDPNKNTFYDVLANAYYFDSVQWAVKNGITSGTSTTTFSPNQTCTKAQIITFLWRAYGSPESNIECKFNDIKSDAYYYNAALWAQEKGLETGSMFKGDTHCTRGQIVTFLYRAMV